jgi:hypothetical protein
VNIRKRRKLDIPATVMPGDTIMVKWRGEDGEEKTFVEDTITHTATYDEAFIFDGELDGRKTIGGGLIEALP